MRDSITVYFRTGGTANFKWQRVGELYPDSQAAAVAVQELRKAGYPAHYERTARLNAIGLPDTYEA